LQILLQNAQPVIYHVIILLQVLNETVCENEIHCARNFASLRRTKNSPVKAELFWRMLQLHSGQPFIIFMCPHLWNCDFISEFPSHSRLLHWWHVCNNSFKKNFLLFVPPPLHFFYISLKYTEIIMNLQNIIFFRIYIILACPVSASPEIRVWPINIISKIGLKYETVLIN